MSPARSPHPTASPRVLHLLRSRLQHERPVQALPAWTAARRMRSSPASSARSSRLTTPTSRPIMTRRRALPSAPLTMTCRHPSTTTTSSNSTPKDNVIVHLICTIQYRVVKEKADDAFYELQNPSSKFSPVFDGFIHP